MITRNFNLYLNAGHSVPLVINVNQYDQGEQWVFTLYNSDGTQYTPSTGAIVGIKSDGLGIINSGSVVDGKVVINETQQMTAAVGKAVFELLIDSQTHGTANFIVLVEEKPGNNADLSESDLSLLQEAIDATSPLPTGGTVGQVLTKTASGSTWSNAGTPTQEQVADAVSDWADEHITVETGVVIDTSLSVAGAAADAKKTGDEISDLKSAISSIGISADLKSALMGFANSVVALIDKVGFENTAGDDLCGAVEDAKDDLYDALYPPIPATAISLSASSISWTTTGQTQQLTATLTPADSTDTVSWNSSSTSVATVSDSGLVTGVSLGSATITATAGNVSATCSVLIAQKTLSSISAVYTQGTVYPTDSLDSLKSDLVVTATWSDASTSTVADADYTLSGTLTVGTSTVTISYGGKTTTFTVTVSSIPEYGTFTPQNIVDGSYIGEDGTVQTSSYGSYSEDYLQTFTKAYTFTFDNLYSSNPNYRICQYDSSKTYIRQVHVANTGGVLKGKTNTLSFTDDIKYLRLSWYGENQTRIPSVTMDSVSTTDLPMEIGDISNTTGENINESKRCRSVGYIPINGSTITVANCPFAMNWVKSNSSDAYGFGTGGGYFFRCYDSSYNLVGSVSWSTADISSTALPTGTAYVRFVTQKDGSNFPSGFADAVIRPIIINGVSYRIVEGS